MDAEWVGTADRAARAMTVTAADRTAELERLLGTDQVQRPRRPLGEGSTPENRDPSPTWDAWYTWPLSVRRRLLAFMAPAGNGYGRPPGISPDELADIIGASSIDAALEEWRRACEMARRADVRWDSVGVDDWAAADAQAEADAELYGPAELAARLGITVANLHQRRHRGLLPAPDLTVSRVPIWTGETIRIWEEHRA